MPDFKPPPCLLPIRILHPTVLQLSEHREPELGSLGLGDPHAQQFLLPFQVDRQHQVKRFIEHALILTHVNAPVNRRR